MLINEVKLLNILLQIYLKMLKQHILRMVPWASKWPVETSGENVQAERSGIPTAAVGSGW